MIDCTEVFSVRINFLIKGAVLNNTMSETKLSFKQKMTQGVHYFKDKLGLPVNYTDLEFSSFKQSVDWSNLPHDRLNVLTMIFKDQSDYIQNYISEGEEIVRVRVGGESVMVGEGTVRTD